MTGLVRKATLLVLCGVLFAVAANAGVPSASNSTKPACIALIGTKSGVADPVGAFTVTVRDLANNPIANSTVVVDFSSEYSAPADCRIGNAQPAAGLTVDCTAKTVRATTNGAGVASFNIVGGAQNAGNSPGRGAGGGKLFADGVFLANVTVQAYDQDGVGGVGANDLSAWLGDKFGAGAPYYGRSDYDCNGSIGANDLSIWLGVKFAANSTSSAAAYCP
jgi:hypothetical protein